MEAMMRAADEDPSLANAVTAAARTDGSSSLRARANSFEAAEWRMAANDSTAAMRMSARLALSPDATAVVLSCGNPPSAAMTS